MKKNLSKLRLKKSVVANLSKVNGGGPYNIFNNPGESVLEPGCGTVGGTTPIAGCQPETLACITQYCISNNNCQTEFPC